VSQLRDDGSTARQTWNEEGRGEGRKATAQQLSEARFFAAPGADGAPYVYNEESGVFKPDGPRVIEETIPLAIGDLPAKQLEPSGPLELLEPSPERPFLCRSEARWDPTAECPALDRILQQTLQSEAERHMLQEYAGDCFFHWARPFQAALLLPGPGRPLTRTG
jgi:hypothetical protein